MADNEETNKSHQTQENERKAENSVETAPEKDLVSANPQNQLFGVENHVVSSEKPKAVSKVIRKAKHTVPQPFSLATEKRTWTERRGGGERSKADVSKSASLNLKISPQTSSRGERSFELKHGAAYKSTFACKEGAEKRTESGPKLKEKTKANEVEAKKLQNAKEGEKLGTKKGLGKSHSFKASPLPSFYHKAPPTKPELKKTPSTRPKSPNLGPRSKSLSQSKSSTKEAIDNSNSKKISHIAKETASRLPRRGLLKAPEVKGEEAAMEGGGGMSCGEGLKKEEGMGLLVKV